MATLPDSLDRPLTTAQSARVKALRAVGAEQAQSLGIAPELLARRKDVELCLASVLADGGVIAAIFGLA